MTGPAATPSAADPEPLHRRLGLTDEELDSIRARLERDPNPVELAMFGVMWSERCSRKSSKSLLATLPSRGPGMVAGPGEKSGVIRVRDGLAVAFRLESHVSSSAAEPDRDAANVVGDVLRSICALGARPLGLLVALRFGDPAEARTRHLVDAVVGGVAGYSHGAGVPIVGGELMFDPSYGGSPLANVMAIGAHEERRLIPAEIPGPGDLVVLFGSAAGHEGLGEASVRAGAAPAARAASGRPRKRPTVLAGGAFAGKLLMEASLEQIERGLVGVIAGVGAGGISRASAEAADRARTGIVLGLDAIPGRQPGVAAFEVLRAESGERMLATCWPPSYPAVREVCERRNLPVAVVGRLTGDDDIATR